jgi:hypothetical protein
MSASLVKASTTRRRLEKPTPFRLGCGLRYTGPVVEAIVSGNTNTLLKRVRLSDEVLTVLLERVLEGAYPAGARLPAERALAEELGLTRTSFSTGRSPTPRTTQSSSTCSTRFAKLSRRSAPSIYASTLRLVGA